MASKADSRMRASDTSAGSGGGGASGGSEGAAGDVGAGAGAGGLPDSCLQPPPLSQHTVSKLALPSTQVLELLEYWLLYRYQAGLYRVLGVAVPLLQSMGRTHEVAADVCDGLAADGSGKSAAALRAILQQFAGCLVHAEDRFPFCPDAAGMDAFLAACDVALEYFTTAVKPLLVSKLPSVSAGQSQGSVEEGLREIQAHSQRMPGLLTSLRDVCAADVDVLVRLGKLRAVVVPAYEQLVASLAALRALSHDEDVPALAARLTRAVAKWSGLRDAQTEKEASPLLVKQRQLQTETSALAQALQESVAVFVRVRQEMKHKKLALRSGVLSPEEVKQVNTQLASLLQRPVASILQSARHAHVNVIADAIAMLQTAINEGDVTVTPRGESAAAAMAELFQAVKDYDITTLGTLVRQWSTAHDALQELSRNPRLRSDADAAAAARSRCNQAKKALGRVRADVRARVSAAEEVAVAHSALEQCATTLFALEFLTELTLESPLEKVSLPPGALEQLRQLEQDADTAGPAAAGHGDTRGRPRSSSTSDARAATGAGAGAGGAPADNAGA